jgi:outer membrane protein assembly factor BamB
MRGLSFAVTLLLGTSLALAQAPSKQEMDEDKVSNDNPARPLQMPPASTEVKEAFDDFDRFQRRGAWERAFKALYTIPEDQAARFVDGEGGFIVPAARKRLAVIAALPPAGQAAYRLFYDSEARKLIEEAEGASELKNLERVYTAYFASSVGDNAADRLGDRYFELGRFDSAAGCWLAIVHDRPDSELSPALLTLKAALALRRSGRSAEFEQLRSELEGRYSDEQVTLDGATASAAELLRRVVRDDPAEADARTSSRRTLDLSVPIEPLWQVRFADSVKAGMVPVELLRWESHPLSFAVPAAAIGKNALFVNELGFVFAVDLSSGKLLWRNEPLHHLKLQTMQDNTRVIDASRFAVVATGDYCCTLGRDLKDGNMIAAYTLTCHRAEEGELVWKSTDLADFNQLDLNGPPIAADGRIFIPAKTHANPPQQQRQPQQLVLAIQPHDGKVVWKAEVGTYREGQRYYFYSRMEQEPQPQLVHRGGAIYVDTHQGILARLDADSGALEWGYGYQTEKYQSSSHFFFYYDMQPQTLALGGPPLMVEAAFLVKGMKSSKISAMEPDRMKVLWERPIAKGARLLGVGRNAVFLGGDEISALDLKTRALLWATRVPGASLQSRVLVHPDGLWQLTSRGIYEIDPDTGAVRRIFRGADLGSAGGDLFRTEQLLLAVSNRTITAYPRWAGKETASHEKPNGK